MDLTDTQARALQLLEDGPLAQDGPLVRARLVDLLELKAEGLVRVTASGESWVITPAGRRALVAVDGQTRLTVEPWRGRNQGGPS